MPIELFQTFNRRQSITYRGNKRKYLNKIFSLATEAMPGFQSCLDLFSGSGTIAAYFRYKGKSVDANDIASYSHVINKINLELHHTYVEENYSDLQDYFRKLNSLTKPSSSGIYFSRYYSENKRVKNPRLFFTERNGKFIDAVLEKIWSLDDETLRNLVLYDLLIKMSRHANTNGVFNAFFKQFGGPTETDLKRILAPIVLHIPTIYDGPLGKSYKEEATSLLQRLDKTYDIIYIDPPYNSHQYISNYHILEYACLSPELRPIPTPDQVSGISPVLFKSSYSRKQEALEAITGLFDACQSRGRHAIVSYNMTGHISKADMLDLMSGYGSIREQSFPIKHMIGAGSRRAESESEEYLFSLSFGSDSA